MSSLKKVTKTIKSGLQAVGLGGVTQKLEHSLRQSQRKKALAPYAEVTEWPLKFGPLDLRYGTQDWYAKSWFYPRYADGSVHEPITTQVFIDQLRKDSVVLDIGGHLGYFSCVAGQLASEGQVHVFEVDPKCLGLIEENIRLNELDHVKVHNFAVSDRKEMIRIPVLEEPHPGLVINSKAGHRFMEVESVVIDDFVKERGLQPDFVKIDVEGAEWKVLNGMQELLKQPQLRMLVEVHVAKLQQFFDLDYKIILEFLLDHGFHIENIESHRANSSSFVQVDHKTVLTHNTMLFCSRPDGA